MAKTADWACALVGTGALVQETQEGIAWLQAAADAHHAAMAAASAAGKLATQLSDKARSEVREASSWTNKGAKLSKN
jgi:hypothetical protein